MSDATGTTKMTSNTKVALAAFTVLRLALVFDLVPSIITAQLNSPPITSALINPLYTVTQLREGNFLLDLSSTQTQVNNTPPDIGMMLDRAYDGMAFHLPPLMLLVFRPLFATVQSRYLQDLVIGAIFVVIDLAVALCLYDICRGVLLNNNARSEREINLETDMNDKIRPRRAWIFGIDPREKDASSGKEVQPSVVTISDLPQLCCLLYYCNPISIVASCGSKAQSLQSLLYLFLLLAVREAVVATNVTKASGKHRAKIAFAASSFLALASYVELYSFVYLVPISIWIGHAHGGKMKQGIALCILFFFLWFGLLQFFSATLVEDYVTVCSKTYGYVHGFFDLSPNMGLNWYFFMQMFDRFRRYFVALFTMLQFIFIAPLTIRLHEYPIILVSAFFLLGVLFKPVQTLHDASIGLAMILMAPRTIARMGNASLVSLFAIVVPATLNVMFYWLWLETGTGNANYMFFQCLAYNVFLAIITLDFISASMKRDKALRLTEKLESGKPPSGDTSYAESTKVKSE
eukprot:CAMPEP_0178517088 /NCGR_PEP_ID=MMETSP0696-20121128/25496_1 /TAXON_ID=265572 /ORGANISM="Extubocellulus spinifer, Strain CCMP396" /LENGTH=518 /DNA_ID=CAMNT_0020147479 /DNA_START=128 /DNA_END=1684 /DNA_ORIENTATION=-